MIYGTGKLSVHVFLRSSSHWGLVPWTILTEPGSAAQQGNLTHDWLPVRTGLPPASSSERWWTLTLFRDISKCRPERRCTTSLEPKHWTHVGLELSCKGWTVKRGRCSAALHTHTSCSHRCRCARLYYWSESSSDRPDAFSRWCFLQVGRYVELLGGFVLVGKSFNGAGVTQPAVWTENKLYICL